MANDVPIQVIVAVFQRECAADTAPKELQQDGVEVVTESITQDITGQFNAGRDVADTALGETGAATAGTEVSSPGSG